MEDETTQKEMFIEIDKAIDMLGKYAKACRAEGEEAVARLAEGTRGLLLMLSAVKDASPMARSEMSIVLAVDKSADHREILCVKAMPMPVDAARRTIADMAVDHMRVLSLLGYPSTPGKAEKKGCENCMVSESCEAKKTGEDGQKTACDHSLN